MIGLKSRKKTKPVQTQEQQGVVSLEDAQKNYAYEGTVEKGGATLVDLLAPSSVDATNMNHFVIDGIYTATLLVVHYPYQRHAGWLDDIISHGEGVETVIYYEPLDRSKTIKEVTHMIGITGAKKKAAGENTNDAEIVDTSLGHARYMRHEMNVANDDPYYIYILVLVYGSSPQQLEERLGAVEGKLESRDIVSRRADFRHDLGFKSCLPLAQLDESFKNATRRNALTKGLCSTYPFVSSEFCDNNGVLIGINEHNKSLVIVDNFNTALYKNANMVILGTSGAGKTFLLQLLALRLRMQQIPSYIIAPLKGHEFRRACEGVGGTFIKIAPGSPHCINVMEIRRATLDRFDENFSANAMANTSILQTKIQKLHIFFSLVFRDITAEEEQDLDEALIEVYARKGMTFDNESLYEPLAGNVFSTERRFKPMPLLEDLYSLLEEQEKTKRLAKLLKMLVKGSLQNFNQHTNVDIDNKYVVFDLSELSKKILPVGMFLTIDMLWDKIKEDLTQKKAIFVDECWKLIGGGGTEQTAQFILDIFKTIRGYGGAAIAATQDVSDFFALEDGKYSKGIINNAKLKFVLQMEEEEARTLEKVLRLSEEEIAKITTFSRGHGLFYAGANHVALEVKASPEEQEMITTDRAELESMKKRQQLARLQEELEEEHSMDGTEGLQ